MSDMYSTIVPKSDQLNADDLIGREMTITVTKVVIRAGQEQPVSIFFEGDKGKPYKPCLSMCRVMVTVWGGDSSQYVGKSMTIFRDSTVPWGGLQIGGIRISHMSDIDKPKTMALTMTRSSKKPFTVKPLVASGATKASPAADAPPDRPPAVESDGGEATTEVNPVYKKLRDAYQIAPTAIKARFDLRVKDYGSIDAMPLAKADLALSWLNSQIDKEVQ